MRSERWMWAGPAAAVAGWLGGSHGLAAIGALILWVVLALRRDPLLVQLGMAVAGPLLLFGFSSLPQLLSLQALPMLAAAVLAWIPLFIVLGRGIPTGIHLLPLTLLVLAPVLIGPWAISVVASDLATRSQVLLLLAVALVLGAAIRAFEARQG